MNDMTDSTTGLNRLWADLIVNELLRNDVELFCISPGSRNTPLTRAVASAPGAQTLLHFDERAAAYHAVGYARATHRPAVVICTSGTAAANYLPAVVESSLDMLPMIVLTADRPPELRRTGANQTIEQANLYGGYTVWQVDLPCPDEKVPPEYVLTAVDQACHRALHPIAGPAHLNCMFREPLLPEIARDEASLTDVGLYRSNDGQRPYTEYIDPGKSPDHHEIGRLASAISKAESGMILVGRLRTLEEQRAVLMFAEKLGWPVFPDITSGLRLGVNSPVVIPYYDLILATEQPPTKEPPELILHFGDRLTSKRLLQYVKNAGASNYIMVSDHPLRHDPLHCVSRRVTASVFRFCSALTVEVAHRSESRFARQWAQMSAIAKDLLTNELDKPSDLSEPLCARLISQNIPDGVGLYLGNSMPVRDMDSFAAIGGVSGTIPVGCNRGASGIDGTIASAAGFARGLHRPVTVLVGDLAFLHDLNSLAMVRALDDPLTIVVVNNNGGGIFSFLPISAYSDIFESFIATPHNLSFEHAAELFDLPYYCPSTTSEFIRSYEAAQGQRLPSLIEVKTDRKANFEIHRTLVRNLREAFVKG